MIRRSVASICIFFLVFNIAFLFAQEEEESDIEQPVDVKSVDDSLLNTQEQGEVDSLNTGAVDEESLSMEIPYVLQSEAVGTEEELPKKKFIGSVKDVTLAVTSIAAWLFFMWLAANQRD